MKKILIITGLLIFCGHLFSLGTEGNARGQSLAGLITVFGDDVNAVNGNPSLLGLQDKMQINITSSIAGLKMEGDSVNSFLGYFVMPIQKIGTIGVGVDALLNFISVNNAELLYSEIKYNLAFGLSINPVFQLGLGMMLKTFYANKERLNGQEVELTPKFNFSLGGNIIITKGINVSLLAANMLGLIYDKKALSTDVAFARAGVGFTGKNKLRGGLAVDYSFMDRKFGGSAAGEIYLLKQVIRLSAGVRVESVAGGVVPKLGAGATLGKIVCDYAFEYPITGVMAYGNHKISLGLVF
jgi:hypothetical protein